MGTVLVKCDLHISEASGHPTHTSKMPPPPRPLLTPFLSRHRLTLRPPDLAGLSVTFSALYPQVTSTIKEADEAPVDGGKLRRSALVEGLRPTHLSGLRGGQVKWCRGSPAPPHLLEFPGRLASHVQVNSG